MSSMLCEIPWSMFRNSGALWFINRTLHLFGLAIVFETGPGEDGDETVKRVYPARCKFRGFDEASETDWFKRLTKYLNAMGETLIAETMDDGPTPPPRIPVADLDPDTLVGIALCDDGSDGWVVMGVQPDPDEPGKEIVAPIGDEHGQIVYLDIKDAAEVLKTGKVWKHDMGDGVADPEITTKPTP